MTYKPQTHGVVFGEPPLTRIASESISKGHMVKRTSTDNTVDAADTQGDDAYGLALNDAAAGEAVTVQRAGTNDIAIAGAALATIGTALMTNSAGRLITATSGEVIVGYNLTAASGDGVAFAIELDLSGKVAA